MLLGHRVAVLAVVTVAGVAAPTLAGCAVVSGRSAEAGTIVAARGSGDVSGTRATVLVPTGRIDLTVGTPLGELAEDDTADLQERRAPDGGAWLPVGWNLDASGLPGYAALMATAPQPVEVRLLTGDETYVLTDDLGSAGGPVYVAVDGDGTDVSLEVEYDGVTQAVGISQDELEPGAAAPLYELPTELPPAPGCPIGGWVKDPGVRGAVTCTLAAPIALPYLPEQGWAEEGRTWVVVGSEVALSSVTRRTGTRREPCDVRSGADATTVGGAGPVAVLSEEGSGTSTTVSAVFDAPAGDDLELGLGRDYEVEPRTGPAFTVTLRRSVRVLL